MTNLTITPQAALAPTTPSVELSQQGLNLSKVVVPTAQILEGLQGAAGKDGSKRVVPFEELQAAAHKLGYGVTEADAKKHGLVDGSKPTTLGKFVEVTKQEGLKNKADGVLSYILHPQDTADKVINKLNEVRADVKEAGIKKAQELAQAPGKGYNPNPVTATAGVFVETGARVGSAAVAGGLGLVSVVVHPVDSVTAAAKALWSPIDTAGKLVDWYQKTPAAEIGEGVLGALVGAKVAAPLNPVIAGIAKKVNPLPPITASSTLSSVAREAIAINAANATLAVSKTVSAVNGAVAKIKDYSSAAKITKPNAKTGKLADVEKPAKENKPNKVAEESKVTIVGDLPVNKPAEAFKVNHLADETNVIKFADESKVTKPTAETQVTQLAAESKVNISGDLPVNKPAEVVKVTNLADEIKVIKLADENKATVVGEPKTGKLADENNVNVLDVTKFKPVDVSALEPKIYTKTSVPPESGYTKEMPLTVETYKLVTEFPSVSVSAELKEGVLSIKMSPERTGISNKPRAPAFEEISPKNPAETHRIQGEMVLRALDHFGNRVQRIQYSVESK